MRGAERTTVNSKVLLTNSVVDEVSQLAIVDFSIGMADRSVNSRTISRGLMTQGLHQWPVNGGRVMLVVCTYGQSCHLCGAARHRRDVVQVHKVERFVRSSLYAQAGVQTRLPAHRADRRRHSRARGETAASQMRQRIAHDRITSSTP